MLYIHTLAVIARRPTRIESLTRKQKMMETKATDKKSRNSIAIWIGLGIAFGASYGAYSGNTSLGVAIGLVVGVIVGAIFSAVKNRK